MRKHVKLGLLELHVPVHVQHVPIHVGHCWGVPVHVQHVPVHVVHCLFFQHVYRYSLTCTGTCARFLPENVWDFAFLLIFSSTNLLQYIPYQKFTMESLQNNSKSGLELMKIHSPQVRTFLPKIQIIEDEVRV